MQQKAKLTKSFVDGVQNPPEGYLIIRDTEQPGFGLRVTSSGAKSYIVERKMSGKTVRATIGRASEISPAEARIEAQALLLGMSRGQAPAKLSAPPVTAPVAIHVASDVAGAVTFRDAALAYIAERKRMGLKARTIDDYETDLDGPLSTLGPVLLHLVDRPCIKALHASLTDGRGPTSANRALRFVRAVMNYALENDDYKAGGEYLVRSNPVMELKKRRLWNKNNRRSRYLDRMARGRWLGAVLSIDRYRWCETHDHGRRRAECVIAYYLLMICLGLRSGETCVIEQAHWNRSSRVLRIADPKNANTAQEEFWLPVGWRMASMIDALIDRYPGRWLLWSESGKSHITDPKAIKRDLCERGETFSPHDLRRTFASVLNEIRPAPSAYQIKRLMNHSGDKDVTTGYVQHDADTLRGILQAVEDEIFGAAACAHPPRIAGQFSSLNSPQ